ncbi:MAG: copper resistance system multicopper oxidase [Gammaproteobacteria bacterium]|nr:copper resistance system multicopper oxidase [Gammaproteobacteria bacterium]
MHSNKYRSGAGISLSRRRFVQGFAAGGTLAGLSPSALYAALQQQGPQTLKGNTFNLTIGEQVVNFTGAAARATTVNGSLPAPVLRMRQGDEVTLNVTNLLTEDSSIHWHGLILPSAMDGVPGVSTGFSGIRPGETFSYRFPLVQSGTYWYHSHSGFQEQTGLYGAIVIDPAEPEPFSYDRDYVVLLSDWSDEDPNAIYRKLKKLSHYYNFSERNHADLMHDIRNKGIGTTWNERRMWNEMRMTDRDLSDVTGYTYTFLMNGQSPAQGWTGLFRRGERIRLRFINSAAMTFFDVRIPGLNMTVIAADGQYIEPVSVEEFRIGVAETYDVIVSPSDDSAYAVFAQAMDRSGYARGTLTPDPALNAEVPEMDPVPSLSHTDMGMDMRSMSHDMAAMDSTTDHSSHDMTVVQNSMDHSGHDMAAMENTMDHSGHDMGTMDSAMAQGAPPRNERAVLNMSDFNGAPVQHADTEYGPHVDMRAEQPRYRLNDPGVGLRNNGRRVLTYADLYHLRGTVDTRDPDREVELHLTGNMGRYMWSIDGVKFTDAEPLRWNLGEQVRVTLVNDTMMNHPMHLHGMWSDLETGDNDYLPRKHTVIVQPGSRISYRVTVDAEGSWAYHCHLLYHMLGMFRTVTVS